jgi:aromatic ring-opening dioxygenase catalytic subunit (LigB family)
MATHLSKLVASTCPEKPQAVLVVSAHWETRNGPTVNTCAAPPLLFDYHGFPPETYELTWPAPGDPALASRVKTLLDNADFRTSEDATRGFDHGVFAGRGAGPGDAPRDGQGARAVATRGCFDHRERDELP